MSLSGLLNTARAGIAAQSGAIGVTSQNVANATTVGYTRRTAALASQAGGGVQYGGAFRTFDRFAHANVVDQQGYKGSADARASALARIEAVIAPPGQTIGDRATALITSFNILAAYPMDPAVRADVLAKADDFANTVSTAARGLTQTSKELFDQAQAVVGEVNDRLGRIADLNDKIAFAKAQGSDASDLRDQRDQSVRDIGERVGVRTVEDAQGRLTLFGAGAVLVEGSRTTPLALDLDPAGAMRVTVRGASTIDITSRVDSGRLGGLREARDVDLARTQSNLDAYAFDVASTINAVHAAGFGGDGGTGRPLFSVAAAQAGAASTMSLDPAMRDRPDRIAAAGSAAELPGGNASAQALAQLADTDSFGGATLANRFGTLAGDVGTRKASADAEVALRDDTLSLAEMMSESASGVSLDEEMIDLTRYQRAFEASAKVLRVADELLDGFLRQF